MAIVVAPNSNLDTADPFGEVPYMGINFTANPQNEWWVVEATANRFVVYVFYARAPSGTPFALTFYSDSGFTYASGSLFPAGVVSRIDLGTSGDGPIAPIPDWRASISGLADLGLSLSQILANPLLVFAGNDVITGGDGVRP